MARKMIVMAPPVKGLAQLAVNCPWCHTASWGRHCSSLAGNRFSLFVSCVYHHSERNVPPSSDRQLMREKVWRDFFSDPSQWWDHRSDKVNPRYPDFKHKKTQQGLWIIDQFTPPWVNVELFTERHVSPDPVPDRKPMTEKLWREFFSDPSHWWDNRSEKVNPRYPDFKHKRTGQPLWLDNSLTPPWVEAELATIAPSLLQSHSFSWNVRLKRHLEGQDYTKTLDLFQQMQREGMMPDKFTFVQVLKACSRLRSLEEGRRVHQQIVQRGCESEIYVANCLINMYANCGSIEDAWCVFNEMRERDVVSWNAMIGGYVKSEQGLKAIEIFQRMRQEGVEPDTVTFVGVLNACTSASALEEGRRIHEQILGRGCEPDVHVATCLVDMYAKCGSIVDAWSVFQKTKERDVISWNAMIVGYVKSEQGLKALELFQTMQREGLEPDAVTFVGALNACASIAALGEGRRVHKQIIRRGCESDVSVANCLVDMYAKCGSIEDAWRVFNKMGQRNVISWTAMIVGYVKSEQGLKALELFQRMQKEGVEPNTVTFVGVLNACASVAASKEGRRVHKQIIQRGYESDVYVATCLVDMYAKCGSIKDARSVFNKIRERDVVSWSAMIGGYAMCGHFKIAIELFERMGNDGVQVNQVTFTSLLSACSHGGLVEKGLHYFTVMTSHYNVAPTWEHYGCIVDLLARAGRLKEAEEKAEEMMERMPMQRDSGVWRSLLGACRIHGNIKMAERAAKWCWELEPENPSAYVLLSNIYAAAGEWDRSAAIEQERLKRKMWNVPGRTWIELKNVVHLFVIDDEEHPQLSEIHAELDILSVQLRQKGYVPDRTFLPPEDLIECHLCENLAVAYGLVSTPPVSPLLIKANPPVSPEYLLCHQGSCKSEKVGCIVCLQSMVAAGQMLSCSSLSC